MLLLGAGRGEATCGILYLASFLRRHGVEAFVRLTDDDPTDEAMKASLASLLRRVRPAIVGISLKWYHHAYRALVMARALRELDPDVIIVVGGNTASWFWRELLQRDAFDQVILGDGEAPLLALWRGDASPPNAVCRATGGALLAPRFDYVQDASTEDHFHYSHFSELFLSEADLRSFSGWIAPGKGCDQSCLYCGGGRAAQASAFGRRQPFLRPEALTRRDHEELLEHSWQLRYDFPGGSSLHLVPIWKAFDLTRHSATYFLWGAPQLGLVDALSETFSRAYLVLDIGCFSERQRSALTAQGLLKRCPSNRALLETIDACRRHAHIKLEVSGIAGLPLTSRGALEEERALIDALLERGCDVGYQRLEAQPGALVTEHPERFGMIAEAQSFADFLAWFGQRSGSDDRAVPMLRFSDPAIERAVDRNVDRVAATLHTHAMKAAPALTPTTRLRTSVAERRRVELGRWLGEHRVPPTLRGVEVTVLRAIDGAGLACVPSLSSERFSDDTVEHGDAARAVLAAVDACSSPVSLRRAAQRIASEVGLPLEEAHEVIDVLVSEGFLTAGGPAEVSVDSLRRPKEQPGHARAAEPSTPQRRRRRARPSHRRSPP